MVLCKRALVLSIGRRVLCFGRPSSLLQRPVPCDSKQLIEWRALACLRLYGIGAQGGARKRNFWTLVAVALVLTLVDGLVLRRERRGDARRAWFSAYATRFSALVGEFSALSAQFSASTAQFFACKQPGFLINLRRCDHALRCGAAQAEVKRTREGGGGEKKSTECPFDRLWLASSLKSRPDGCQSRRSSRRRRPRSPARSLRRARRRNCRHRNPGK